MRGVRIAIAAGDRFGRLVVMGSAGNLKRQNGSKGSAIWNVRCDCGKRKVVLAARLADNSTVSCGCFRSSGDQARTHGKTKSREYNVWKEMIARCERPTATGYAQYGGNGIRVCRRWRRSFEAFLEDMGPRPIGTSLDRFPDNTGNYEPNNCRWATPAEQSRNRIDSLSEAAVRSIRRRLASGERQVDVARSLGKPVQTINNIAVGRRYAGYGEPKED